MGGRVEDSGSQVYDQCVHFKYIDKTTQASWTSQGSYSPESGSIHPTGEAEQRNPTMEVEVNVPSAQKFCSPLFSPSQSEALESGSEGTIALLTQRMHVLPGNEVDEVPPYMDISALFSVRDEEAIDEVGFPIDEVGFRRYLDDIGICLRCHKVLGKDCTCKPWVITIPVPKE